MADDPFRLSDKVAGSIPRRSEPEEPETPPLEAYADEYARGEDTPEVNRIQIVPPIRWPELEGKDPPARDWLIDGWLGRGHATLFAGPGAVGKSLLGQCITTALSLGIPYLDEISRRCTVLTWACEDDAAEIWRRQVHINAHFGACMDDLTRLHIVPRSGEENTLFTTEYGRPLWTPAIGILREQIGDLKPDAVLLDNIGHVFGGSENDRHHVTAFLNGLMGAAGALRPAIVVMGHPARATGSEFAGSGAWENACRMRWWMGYSLPDAKGAEEDEKDENERFLCKRKANYTVRDYRRFTLQNHVLVPDPVQATGGVVDAIRARNIERTVLRAVAWLNERELWCSHAKASRERFLPKRMAAHGLLEGATQAEAERAMNRLIGDKALLVDQVVAKNSQRHPISGLMPAPESEAGNA